MKKGGLPPFSSLFPGLFFHFFAFFDSLKAGHTPGFFFYALCNLRLQVVIFLRGILWNSIP